MAKSSFKKFSKTVLKHNVGAAARVVRVLEQKKDTKVVVDKGSPKSFEGNEGDIQIRELANKGVFLFSKYNGSWVQTKLDNGSESFNPLIYSNTASGDILVYDYKKGLFVSRTVGGDISMDDTGNLKLRKGIISSYHLPNNIITENLINHSSISSNHIKNNSIKYSHIDCYSDTKAVATNTITAIAGSSLNVGGAKATAEVTVTSPSGGTAATGSITLNTEKVSEGSKITIDDGIDEAKVFEFCNTETINTIKVAISNNRETTMENLKVAINTYTDITATRSGKVINLTHKIFGPEGNNSITQNKSEFTLVGMTSGVAGEYFELPTIGNGKPPIRVNYRPTTSSNNAKARINVESTARKNSFVKLGADATGTAANTVASLNKSGFNTSNSSGVITLEAGTAGTSGNGTIIDGGSHISVGASFTGGTDATEKYLYLYHPIDYDESVEGSAYTDLYHRVIFGFNIGGTHQAAEVTSSSTHHSTYIRIEGLTTSSTAQDVSDKIVSEINAYTYNDVTQFTASNGSSVNITIGVKKPGYTPDINAGTSGMTVGMSAKGGVVEEHIGSYKLENKTQGDMHFKTAGSLKLESIGSVNMSNITEVGSDTDKFLMSDGGDIKYVTGANLKTYIGAGDISFDGSTANGVCTYKDADEVTVESTLTYSAQLLTLSGGDTKITASNAGDGYDLTLAAGTAGSGVNNHGGNILLEAGTSTGAADGGYLSFSTSEVDGVSGSSSRARETVFFVGPLGSIILNDADGYPGEYKTYNRNTGTTYATLKSSGLYSNTSLSVDGGDGSVTIDDDGHTYATFTKSDSSLKLHEAGTDASGEYFKIACGVGGSTDMTTTSSILPTGHLTINPYGKLSLNGQGVGNNAGVFCETLVRIKEVGSSATNLAGYGQLWTKDRTPNELWFTNDAGTDIQITQGSTRAGIHPIISSMVFR